MLKRIAFVLGVCAVVAVAYGAANKIKEFYVYPPEDMENADGMAILNYASGDNKTIIQLILSDFSPDTTYSWVLHSSGGDLLGINLFTTDDKGHATFHTEVPEEDVSDSDIDLFVDGNGNLKLDEGELRAVGVQDP